jgi:RNA polymerase sigma factor (TIGR02999 family)
MSDVTRILARIESGDRLASEELLPVVYEELRRLAAREFSHERGDHTLQATALVHEAYLRLVDQTSPQQWETRGHFFSAAAEAMRRILVESARRRASLKRGGDVRRHDIDGIEVAAREISSDVLAVDDALERLSATDRDAAELVKLRYFSGLTIAQAAEVLGIPARSADRLWAYSKAWLHREIRGR